MSKREERLETVLRRARVFLKHHGWCLHHQADRGQYHRGHCEGDECWSIVSDIDALLSEPSETANQTAVDDLVEEYERDPEKRTALADARTRLPDSDPEQCPHCGGAKPCLRVDCQGEPEGD